MPEFKYEIGAILQIRLAKQMRCQVIERLSQQCHGGVQLHYKCRVAMPNKQLYTLDENKLPQYIADLQQLYTFTEVELQPLTGAET